MQFGLSNSVAHSSHCSAAVRVVFGVLFWATCDVASSTAFIPQTARGVAVTVDPSLSYMIEMQHISFPLFLL